MTSAMEFSYVFVDQIPDDLEDGVLYVCLRFTTVIHRCCCGCSNEVVTPLSKTDWQLTFDGESISLTPSIGNWSFPCRSHYWIQHNQVKWAPCWSQHEVETGRSRDRIAKRQQYRRIDSISNSDTAPNQTPVRRAPASRALLKVRGWFKVRKIFK